MNKNGSRNVKKRTNDENETPIRVKLTVRQRDCTSGSNG
jgi:hypothetical protein